MKKALVIVFFTLGIAVFLHFWPDIQKNLPKNEPKPSISNSAVWILDGSGVKTTVFNAPAAVKIFDLKGSLNDSRVFYAGTDRGLFISGDSGVNWYEQADSEKNINSSQTVYKIEPNRFNPAQIFISVFGGGRGRVYETRDNFSSLEPIFDIPDQAVYDLEAAGNQLYLGISDGRLLSYSPASREFRPLAGFGSSVIDVEAVDGRIYAATRSEGLFVSFDGGRNFSAIQDGLALQSGGRLNSLAIQKNFGSKLYVASLAGVFRSLNKGGHWESLKTLAANPDDGDAVFLGPGDDLYLGSGGYLYRSIDSGNNWQIVLNLGKERRISSIYFAPNGKIIVGTR